MGKTVESKPTVFGTAAIERVSDGVYVLKVGGRILAQSGDWNAIKQQYDAVK